MSGDAAVSVVIPAWNRADRIEGAILSALEQEPKPLEIIVVDDGSTDGTDAGRLVALDARVRVIRHDANRGAAEARNTGVAAARGDWIAFLDSDDRWLPGKLARQLAQVAGAGEHRLFACGNVLLEGGAYDGRLYNARPPAEGEDISRYFTGARFRPRRSSFRPISRARSGSRAGSPRTKTGISRCGS
jgi:glycosyltransferase involved in cell wall biosynthesis